MPSKPEPNTYQALSPSAKKGNLRTVSSLKYVRNIDERVDGRSFLGLGLRYHHEELLKIFDVRDGSQLDTIELETIRRLKQRRIIRELSWARVQDTMVRNDLEAFLVEAPRFQAAVDAEERSEEKLKALLVEHRARQQQSLPKPYDLKVSDDNG